MERGWERKDPDVGEGSPTPVLRCPNVAGVGREQYDEELPDGEGDEEREWQGGRRSRIVQMGGGSGRGARVDIPVVRVGVIVDVPWVPGAV